MGADKRICPESGFALGVNRVLDLRIPPAGLLHVVIDRRLSVRRPVFLAEEHEQAVPDQIPTRPRGVVSLARCGGPERIFTGVALVFSGKSPLVFHYSRQRQIRILLDCGGFKLQQLGRKYIGVSEGHADDHAGFASLGGNNGGERHRNVITCGISRYAAVGDILHGARLSPCGSALVAEHALKLDGTNTGGDDRVTMILVISDVRQHGASLAEVELFEKKPLLQGIGILCPVGIHRVAGIEFEGHPHAAFLRINCAAFEPIMHKWIGDLPTSVAHRGGQQSIM